MITLHHHHRRNPTFISHLLRLQKNPTSSPTITYHLRRNLTFTDHLLHRRLLKNLTATSHRHHPRRIHHHLLHLQKNPTFFPTIMFHLRRNLTFITGHLLHRRLRKNPTATSHRHHPRRIHHDHRHAPPPEKPYVYKSPPPLPPLKKPYVRL
ncbi:hypothetical protein ACP275_03G092900 [Erythranthe tilingii]